MKDNKEKKFSAKWLFLFGIVLNITLIYFFPALDDE